MKTLIPSASGWLLIGAVAILATPGIVVAQSVYNDRAGGSENLPVPGADLNLRGAGDAATLERIKTLDQIRQLPTNAGTEEDALGFAEPIQFTNVVRTPAEPRRIAMKRISELRAKLESSDDRTAIEPLLRTALAEYFLADMQHRVRELDEIKAKVAETEAKLQRRLDSQQESIDLQLKLFLQEADGFGFFRAEDSRQRPAGGTNPFTWPKTGRSSLDPASN